MCDKCSPLRMVNIVSDGGDHDDHSYRCGIQMGSAEEKLRNLVVPPGQTIYMAIFPCNRQQMDLIAMSHGYTMVAREVRDGWLPVDLTKINEFGHIPEYD